MSISDNEVDGGVMNQYVPDWNIVDDSRYFRDLPTANQKNLIGPESEFVELLWQNGNVVMHSQNNRNTPASDFKQVQRPEQAQQPLDDSSTLIQEDETASWFQYPLEESLEKDFSSDFFSEMKSVFGIGSDKMTKDVFAGKERHAKCSSNNESDSCTASAPRQYNFHNIAMPPPKSHTMHSTPQITGLENNNGTNLWHFSRSAKAELGSSSGTHWREGLERKAKGRGQESSMMTVGSSFSGSNQIHAGDPSSTMINDMAGVAAGGQEDDARNRFSSERSQRNAYETTVTSSSGGSGCSVGRSAHQGLSNQNQKRKERDAEDLECQSKEAEHESVQAKKPTQRSTSTRRSRAAEVHNLSERRRRDRINEKMKALQELIPHCNKTDKASMLDEAIEYLKSLRLQVQMMWMGSGMAPMMFPGVQQYMSAMGMGMGHASLPSLHNSVHLPRVPFLNQSVASVSNTNQTPLYPSPPLNGANFPNQMQNIHLPESYAHYLGFHHMQPHPQAMNFYAYGSQMTQQNQSAAAPNDSILRNTGGAPSENIGANEKPG